jgi:hypothetical protein
MRRGGLSEFGQTPILVPCAAVVVVLLIWSQDGAGQALTSWAPGTLLVLALLAVTVIALRDGWSGAPRSVRAATLALGGFTVWSFASIAWAGDAGAAWDGANRTLLYLAVFALFALWRQTARSGSLLLGAWTLGMVALALVTLLRISGAADVSTLFAEDRLSDPAGYPNAAACMWLMALWPAVVLAANRRVHFALRGVVAGGAVLLLEVALLSLSRGALFAFPVVAIVFFACFPDRLRRFAVAVPIAIAAAAAVPAVLDVGPAVLAGGNASTEVDAMVAHVLIAAFVAGIVVAAAAWFETGREFTSSTTEMVRRVTTALAIVTVVLIASAGAIRAGNPVDRVNSAWDSFKGGYAEQDQGSRLVSGLGSNRYDFYRVGLDLFKDHPLRGVGADNYFIEYLQQGRSTETPRYPHSVELRTASQTGVVGVALMLAFLGFAAAAVVSVRRARDPVAAAVATGAAMVFVYWLVHDSVDWFWEFAGLGAPAFAFLGLACALAPRRQINDDEVAAARGVRWALIAALAVAAVSVTLPWLSERDVQKAAAVYDSQPFTAYDRLKQAARLNPLSSRPELVAGSIALRYSDFTRADQRFSDALERVPDDQYATLMRGAIASDRGDRAAALRLLDRAATLAPRDRLTLEARAIARDGGRIDVANLTRKILGRATVFSSR